MSADLAAVLLILAAAPAATLFPILYARRPWRRTLIGWALMIHSIGMAALIDISLLYKWLGDDYYLRDVVRLTVYAFIVVGINLTTLALLRTPRDPS